MRPVVERRYVFIGSVIDKSLSEALKKRSQREKDSLLHAAMAKLELAGASGRLGTSRFTLVGDEQFGSSMSKIGKERLEGLLCSTIAKELDDATTDVDVLASGAVVLGDNIVCDGYAPGREFRVQTHIHDDHMGEFDRSKGCQDIVLSPETLSLLIAEYNADLAYRENLLPVNRGDRKNLDDGSAVQLLASNHILGSCQVAVDQRVGRRVGYSGDFGWPLDDVIEVDELVVDSTYGSPRSVRRYTQAEAEVSLMEVVFQRLRHGCGSHPGT